MTIEFKRVVILESPYAGQVERNLRFLRFAMRDAFLRGELPFASHALYTQPGVLDDTNPAERELGIRAGFTVAEIFQLAAEAELSRRLRGASSREMKALPVARVMLGDLGRSSGMRYGEEHAREISMDTEHRLLGWKEEG